MNREGRLIQDDARESNVDFRLPYDTVLAMWQGCMAQAYQPAALLARYQHRYRGDLPQSPQAAGKPAAGLLAQRQTWAPHVAPRPVARGIPQRLSLAILADRPPRLARGDIERVIMIGLIGHHLIRFAREASAGQQNASHYASRLRELSVAAE